MEPLLERLAKEGFLHARVQPQGELLVLKLSQEEAGRLLSDSPLRQDVVSLARQIGFSRVALELPSSDNNRGGVAQPG